jgi:hypothetical protein
VYNFALFLHLLGVFLLIGAVTTTLVATWRAQTTGSVAELRSLTAVTKRIEVVMIPAMLLIIGPGLYMVSRHGGDGSIQWSAGWVGTALVVALLLAVVGSTVEAKYAQRLRDAIARASSEFPHDDLRALQRASIPMYVSFFGASQIVALLFLMTIKPDLTGSIAACAVAVAGSALAASARIRAVRRNVPTG